MNDEDLMARFGLKPSAMVPVARSVRQLTTTMVRRRHDPEVLAQAGDLINQALALLEGSGEVIPIPERLTEDPDSFQTFFERQMVAGPGNPFAPPAPIIEVADGRARGAANLSRIYQGPPGRVHGGYVAVLLDHITGAAASTALSMPYYTRVLDIEYLAGTPLDTDLELRGWVDERDGRKAWIIGEVRLGDVVCARGKALMVQPKKETDD